MTNIIKPHHQFKNDSLDDFLKHYELLIIFDNDTSLSYFKPEDSKFLFAQISYLQKLGLLTMEDYRLCKWILFVMCTNYRKVIDYKTTNYRAVAQRFIGRSKIRQFIFNRDKQCLKCGSTKNLQIDHIKAVSIGGENKLSNLQTLCRVCNVKKRTNYQDYR